MTLTDAGGGAGDWTVATTVQQAGAASRHGARDASPCPGRLDGDATVPAPRAGDATGFVVLTRGTDVRRIPFWVVVVDSRSSQSAPRTALSRPGVYRGTTGSAAPRARSARYRYPTGGD